MNPDQISRDFSFKFEGDFNFLLNFYKGISFIKLNLISFFNARYLTASLRGPVLNLTARAKPEFHGHG